MRKLLLTYLVILGLSGFGQSIDQIHDLADKYYASGKYVEAVDFYARVHEVEPQNLNVHLKLALSLYHSLQYDASKRHFQALVHSGYWHEEVLYYYGWLLKTEGEYKRADSVFDLMLNWVDVSMDYKKLASFQQEGCKLGIRMLKVKNPHHLEPFDEVNSEAHDFGFVRFQNMAALSTTRNTKQKQFYDGQYGGLLPNILELEKGEEGAWELTETFQQMNTKWGEGTGCFSHDGKSFYFSSCESEKGCKIYVSSQNEEGAWTAPIVLNENINKAGYDSKQPNVSQTGDTLFFASNRPGGIGGTDLWMSFKVKGNEWAPAVNLGETINTVADEMSPYYSSTFRALVFSSNGHAGYGGYDNYLAKGVSFFGPKIYNIGPPFNSSYDDNYFSLHNGEGYISTNRNHTDFDIFKFDYDNEIELLKSFMNEESLIDLILQGSNSLDLYAFRLEEYEGYHLLRPKVEIREEIQFDNNNNFQSIAGDAAVGSVIRLNLNDTLEMLTLTNDENRFEIRMLSDTLVNHMVTENGTAIEYEWQPMAYDGYKYNFEKIYFDFDSHDLRVESKETLKDLVKVFRSDNVVMVDIHTHTDHFGDHDYNYELSENRGLSIMQFLHNQGLDYSQIRVFPNGEKNLISDHDPWYSRLFNRRAEIIVYTSAPVSFTIPEVYIVRSDVRVEEAARFLKVADTKLYEWNGLSVETDLVQEGHVIRVFDPKHLVPNYRYLIPENAAGKELIYYTIQEGDTFSKLADQFNVPEEVINEENQLFGDLEPGIEIIIYADSWSFGI
ncbi:MAG: OmpA family protein [Cyclobacteriaceae bacterium]